MLSNKDRLGFRCTMRCTLHAGDADASLVDCSVGSERDLRAGADEREVTTTTGDLVEGRTRTLRSGLQLDLHQQLIVADGRDEVCDEEVLNSNLASALWPSCDEHSIECAHDGRCFGRRIRVSDAAADGPPRPDRTVRDMRQSLGEQRCRLEY